MGKKKNKAVGDCPLCGRVMLSRSCEAHHLIPVTFKGKETVILHRICHRKLHSCITEREMQHYYHTIERLIEHEEVQKFIRWVMDKDPEFYVKNKETRVRKGKRRK